MEQQTPIVFTNRNGYRLFGILHTPHGRARREGVLLLSPGVKMRLGPQCLYRRMTEMFVGLGFPVFRFDFHGLGDAEGELQETLLADVYNHIEVGRYVDDTLDAVDWMQARCGVSRVIVSGLCGGAITGLLAGNRDRRIAGLIGLGITPVLASRAADPSAYMTIGQLTELRRGYIRKLLDPKSWLRLLTLRSDFRLIWRSLIKPISRRPVAAASQPSDASASTVPDNANPLFPPAFFDMTGSDRPLLLVFSGADRLYWEFEEKFLARYGDRLKDVQSAYDVHVIPNANHVLSFRGWQDEMLDVSSRWLRERFGATPVDA